MQHIKTANKEYYLDDNDKLHGEYKKWYDNGQPWELCHWVHGKHHGEYKHWYINGRLSEHCHYVHGKRHGEYKHWYINGRLSEHCHYVHGKRHGEYKSWYSDGQLRAHTYIINDEVIHNLMKNPLSDEEKFELQLTHGGKWLCDI